jgi:hypothetical protein
MKLHEVLVESSCRAILDGPLQLKQGLDVLLALLGWLVAVRKHQESTQIISDKNRDLSKLQCTKKQHQCSHKNQQQCYAGGSGFATNQEYLVLTVKLRMCCIEFLPSLAGTCRIIFTPYTANGGVYCSFICRSTATPVIQIMIVRIKIDKPELLNIINHSTLISSHLHCTKRNYCHSCNQMSILDVNPNWKAAEQYKCDT